MKRIRRSYGSPFALDISKLTRLHAVLIERLSAGGSTVSQRFKIQLSNEKTFETESLQDVVGLDNSIRNRVLDVSFSCRSSLGGVSIDFDGKEPSVEIISTSEDAQLAADVQSAAEEQAERTLQSGPLYRLARASSLAGSGSVLLLLGLLISMFPLLFGTSERPKNPDYSSQLWLTDKDLEELRTVSESQNLNSAQMADITRRQLRNLLQARSERQRPVPPNAFLAVVRNWRSWLVAAPILVIAFSIGYLLKRCYPQAVFLWGDAVDSYERLLGRRKAIWQVILASILVSLLTNLSVFALSGFFRGN